MSHSTDSQETTKPWYQLLTRYHWFVFLVCSLGWGFDCFDQQLFNVVKNSALAEVMQLDASDNAVASMTMYATSLMLIGWATGGILFGIMGDKYGRAKTMILAIFTYAVFTGFSGLATHWWDFCLYRFLTGLGVGGQFAAGVTLLAETMPDRARPKTLGLLQIVAAVGNMSAALLTMLFNHLGQLGMFGGISSWRILFFVGFLPAILAIFVMRKLEEPEKWKAAIAEGKNKKAGSVGELFRHPRWRYNVIVGMILATCGVIGLWGIAFFSIDLTQITFRNFKNAQVRESNENQQDVELIRMIAHSPQQFFPLAKEKGIIMQNFIDSAPKLNDLGAIFLGIQSNSDHLDDLTHETILATLDKPSKDRKRKAQTAEERMRRAELLSVAPKTTDRETFDKLADQIVNRSKQINGYVIFWGSIASLLFNFGAVFGTYLITLLAERFGRRPAFTIMFSTSLIMTVLVFLCMDTWQEVLWMTPLLGFTTLSLFGGYAIYFPELFPTHLRSTAVSFCYNIGRFAAATGPTGLGLLTSYVFYNAPEPIRYAGVAMSLTFVVGIIVTWFGPETKGKPLPE